MDTALATHGDMQTRDDRPLCAIYRSEFQESARSTPDNLALLDGPKSLDKNLFKSGLRNVLRHALDEAQWCGDGEGRGV
jgi:hypothetical protein